MDKNVAQKIARLELEIRQEIIPKIITAKDLLELSLTAFPDSYHEQDKSWNWCWDELGDDAQDYVQEIRALINLFLKWKKDE